MEPATAIIGKLGGEAKVAAIAGTIAVNNREELHARQDGAAPGADRGERRSLSAPTGQRGSAGAVAGAHNQDDPADGEDRDFRYVVEEDVYSCPAGERLAYAFTAEENGLVLRRYSTNACRRGAIKQSCTTGKERRITRWEA